MPGAAPSGSLARRSAGGPPGRRGGRRAGPVAGARRGGARRAAAAAADRRDRPAGAGAGRRGRSSRRRSVRPEGPPRAVRATDAPPGAASRSGRAAAAPAVAASAGDRRGTPAQPLDELVAGLAVDVPDFPMPGVLFKDLTPVFADGRLPPDGRGADRPRTATRGGGARGRRRLRRRRRRRGPRLPARRGRRARAPASGWSRSARPASCRARGHRADYALEYGEATLELHADALRAGPAGAARRRRPGHRRHPGRGGLRWSSGSAPSSSACRWCSSWPPSAGGQRGRAARRARPLGRPDAVRTSPVPRACGAPARLAWGGPCPTSAAQESAVPAGTSPPNAVVRGARRARAARRRGPPSAPDGPRCRAGPPPRPTAPCRVVRTTWPPSRPGEGGGPAATAACATGWPARIAGRPAQRAGVVRPVLEPLVALHRQAIPRPTSRCCSGPTTSPRRAHAGQLRKSGDPYITHPLAVATILAELGMDTTTLVAALLHDTVEDTGATARADRRATSATRSRTSSTASPSSTRSSSATRPQAETIRKMIVAMARDPRVLVIKLADRLHNMRTLRFLPPEKQERKAARDAGDPRPAGPPARHEHDQVGARGPRVRDPVPEALRRDRAAGGRARARPATPTWPRSPTPVQRAAARRPRSRRSSPAGRSTTTRSTRR